jgi:Outer membrane protein beta-barrel domain
MNTRLLSLGSLAAVLAIASPSIASEVASVSDTATNTFNSEFVKSNNEAFTASTSAQSLGTFEAQKEIKPTFTENSTKTEVAQYGGDESDSKGFYLGGNLGLFIPTYNDVDTGFGGGGNIGYQFNKNWAAEVDLGYVGADFSNFEKLSMQYFYVLPTARYIIPLGSDDDSKWAAHVGIGLGFTSQSFGGDNGKNLEGDSYFTSQVKAGVSYKFNPKLEAFGQIRYIYMFDSAIDINTLEKTGGGFVSPELGLQYNF